MAVGHSQMELCALPEGSVQPEPKTFWKNTGESGVFLALGCVSKAVKNAKHTIRLIGANLAVVTFTDGCPKWLSFHGGDADGVRFFGWRCSVVHILLRAPMSVCMQDVLVTGGFAYAHTFATLTARLVDNAAKQLLFFCRNAALGATCLEREYIKGAKKKVKESQRKRRLNLNADNPPPCLRAALYPRKGKPYPKNGQRWRVAAVVRDVAARSGVPVNSVVDIPLVQQAWEGAKAESAAEFVGALESTTTKAYTVHCLGMAKCQMCPYNGDTAKCAASRKQSVPLRNTPADMWLKITYDF